MTKSAEQKAQEEKNRKSSSANTNKPTDAEIIAANPNATPYELLDLGISESKFQELLVSPPTANGGELKKLGENGEILNANPENVTVAEAARNLSEGKETGSIAPIKPVLVDKVTQLHQGKAQTTKSLPVNSGGGVTILNDKGQRVEMSAKAAQRLMRMNGNYTIVNQ